MLKHEDSAVAPLNGNNLQPLAGISVTVTDKTTGLPASLYADDGTTPIANPQVTDNKGYYGFKAPDGTYVLTFSGQRIATFTREIVLDDPKDNPYVTVAGLAAGQGASGVGYGSLTVASALDSIGPRATKFGIFPNTNQPIDKILLASYFAACNTLAIPALFDAGTYKLNDSGFILPDHGAYGAGRNATVFEVADAVTGDVFKLGQLNQWTKVKGNVSNLRIQTVSRACAANLLNVDTPTRGVTIDNVSFLVGSGACVTLTNTFYLTFITPVFEGPFNANLATSTADLLIGTAIKGTEAKEINNVTVIKPDVRYLSRILDLPNTPFIGSNCIKFVGGAYEYIGDTPFVCPGTRLDLDNPYFEKLDRNQNVTGRPNESTTILMTNGGADCIIRNVLLNLSGVRSTAKLLTHTLGTVTFEGGDVTNKPTTLQIIDPVTYTQRGVVINNGCNGLGFVPRPALEHYEQQRALIFPGTVKEPIFGQMMGESTASENTLVHQSWPSAQIFSFQTVQPIVSVEGRSDTSTTLVEVLVTLYRYLPATATFGLKRLALTFLVKPDMATTITPTVTVLESSGDQGGFSDASILTKIEAFRRTPARTDMNAAYTWHYQVCIRAESGGATGRILANRVETHMIWIDGGARDTVQPAYSIYPQECKFASP